MKNVSVSQTWRELYLAALCETDEQKLLSRIDEAEKALILRHRELFALSGDNSQEAEALDDGLYALRALRSSVRPKTSESEAA
jgi:hypothetical protein